MRPARVLGEMADYDLILRGGEVMVRDVVVRADIGIADGSIIDVAESLGGTALAEIDATGLHVFPGGIDPHVHFDEPGRTDWEGFASGTSALAAGGYTAYVDMPLNCVPPTTDGPSFDLKAAAARASSIVDYGFWGGLVPGNGAKLDELAERGVLGFKTFMCDGGLGDFPGVDDLQLYEGMRRIAELDSILLLHAENEAIVSGLAKRAVSAGATGPHDYVATRPPIAEIEAIARAIFFAEETGCRIHIVHVSTARGVRMVAAAQARGVDVSCETCPHFLLFTEDDLDTLGVALKTAPPVRTPPERDELWELLRSGVLPIVTSDHSPGAPALRVGDDFFALWGGVSGCQSTLQLLLAEGHTERNVNLSTIARTVSTNVAQRFGMSAKGEIAAGFDADLVLVDMKERTRLAASDLLYRHQVSAYVGQRLRGRIVRTLVRGITVYNDGRCTTEPVGRMIRPER